MLIYVKNPYSPELLSYKQLSYKGKQIYTIPLFLAECVGNYCSPEFVRLLLRIP